MFNGSARLYELPKNLQVALDFMNSEFIIDTLVPQDTKTVDGITFNLKRYVEDGYIFKDIAFTADGSDYKF